MAHLEEQFQVMTSSEGYCRFLVKMQWLPLENCLVSNLLAQFKLQLNANITCANHLTNFTFCKSSQVPEPIEKCV